MWRAGRRIRLRRALRLRLRRAGGDDHEDINLTISMRLPFGKQDLQQLHRFALTFFSVSGAATRRTRPRAPPSADSWRDATTGSGTNGSSYRVAAVVRQGSWLVIVVVAQSLDASS